VLAKALLLEIADGKVVGVRQEVLNFCWSRRRGYKNHVRAFRVCIGGGSAFVMVAMVMVFMLISQFCVF